MRGNKFMEQIILNEVDAFERKKELALTAVSEYAQSVKDQVLQRSNYNIQKQFEESQKVLQDACRTLDRVIIGLANMSPSPDSNSSLPIGDVPRPMLTSETVTVNTQLNHWSTEDCSAKTKTQGIANPPSPDIVESFSEPMVEPSSDSSTCSTSSSSDAQFKTRIRNIIKQQPQRAAVIDEFAMDIPDTAQALNVDAPEFTPAEFAAPNKKPSLSQILTNSNDTPQQNGSPPGKPKENSEPKTESSSALNSSSSTSPKSKNMPTIVNGSSSAESYSTPPAADVFDRRDGDQSSMMDYKSTASSVTNIRSPNGIGTCNNVDKLACNGYLAEAESRPSSHHTKGITYDPMQVLGGAAQVLQAEQEDSLSNKHTNDNQTDWSQREVAGDRPPNVKFTRVPPLWSYVHVSFSDVDLDTGRTYVQIVADVPFLHKINDEMYPPRSGPATEPLKWQDVSDELFVTAPFHESRYRARVVSKRNENDIEVFFVDYGNKAKVRLQDLTAMKSKSHYRFCKFAIPCYFDFALKCPNLLEGLPELAYVCFGNPVVVNQETVYPIMDLMSSSRENYRELPDSAFFEAREDPCELPYTVVISYATSPSSMWLVETKDLNVPKEIRHILQELPPEPCREERIQKSVYVVYDNQRAMITDRRDDRIDLYFIDSGKSIQNVAITDCRRLPLMAHTLPAAAKVASLANCLVPQYTPPEIQESTIAAVVGRTFLMRVKKDSEYDEVFLVDPNTRKRLATELEAKFAVL